MRIAHWREKQVRYRLTGSSCRSCGSPVFPPRLCCPLCSANLARQVDAWEALVLSTSLVSAGKESGI